MSEKEINLRAELPFRVEYAKSNRSNCKGCKNKIEKDELRLAIMVKNFRFDGLMPNWYHFDCFFEKIKLKSTGDIAHFCDLRFEDQEKIQNQLKKTENNTISLDDFKVEYAKSAKSGCFVCETKIMKAELRVGVMDHESEQAMRFKMPISRWFHVDCFVQKRDQLGFFESGEKLTSFDFLEPEDQQIIKKKIPKISIKRKPTENLQDVSKKSKKDSKKLSEKLKAQSILLYGFIDELKKLKKKEIILLLEHNNLFPLHDLHRNIELLADCMAFGALKKCPECHDGQLRFRIAGYICTGNITEWAKCIYQTQSPKRQPFLIPDDLKEKYSFLKNYQYQKQERVYPLIDPTVLGLNPIDDAFSQPSTSMNNNQDEFMFDPNKPLAGHKVAIFGKTKIKSKELKDVLIHLGADCVKIPDRSVLFAISNQDEVAKFSSNVEEAKKVNVIITSENIIKDLKSKEEKDIPSIIMKHSICEWGTDLEKKFFNLNNKSKLKSFKSGKSKSGSTNFPERQIVKLKDGLVIDPQSGLQDLAHVYREKETIYSVVLNKVDLIKNKNSYYKMQILESDINKNMYWLFISWGRTGTDIGDYKTNEYKSKEKVKEDFINRFHEKTGNDWNERNNFKKKPNLYYIMDINYNDEKLLELKTGDSELPIAIQELVCILFDVQKMKQGMMEFELDLTKLPLGKLSKKQISSAYSLLKDISNLLNEKVLNKSQLLDYSNRFYTLVPHNFGEERLKVLNSEKMVTEKREMLEMLQDIEIAYEMISEVKKENKSEDLLKQHYDKLNIDINVVSQDEIEYKLIEEYVKNTHAKTHSEYKLKIIEIFRISRYGERERYKKYAQMHNRFLLWHGSRCANYAGILSQGLRIAPNEAPATGYMFGKGIYFADMVSKSANYCFSNASNNVGLLLLCEVALGNMWELGNAKDIKKLPKNKHSVKGIGKTVPNPEKNKTLKDGVIIPNGEPIKINVENTSLLYNEYIVYDVAQVLMRFLIKVEFEYNYDDLML